MSDKCFAVTSRMMCSKCDADISTGVNPDKSICLSFCDEWYLSCMEDYLDPYVDPKEGQPFCTDDSMVCSPVHEVVNHSRAFCEHMGYKVMSDVDAELVRAKGKQPVCFTGIPR